MSKELRELRIESVRFQRIKAGEWEQGILINEGQLILDMDGNPLKVRPWSWTQIPRHVMTVIEEAQ